MGYAHAMMGNTLEAVDCFHKALGLRRDDTFSTTMLNYVIEQLVDDPKPFDGNFGCSALFTSHYISCSVKF